VAEWSIQLPYRDRDAKLNLAEIADDVAESITDPEEQAVARALGMELVPPRRSDVRRCSRSSTPWVRRVAGRCSTGPARAPGCRRPQSSRGGGRLSLRAAQGRPSFGTRMVAARRSAAMRGAGTPPETARSGWFDPPRGLRSRAPVGGGEDRGFVVATKNKSRAQCQRPIRGEMGRRPLCALDEGHQSSP